MSKVSFANTYFPYSWFPFHFADVFFSCIEAFNFDEASFILSFLSLALGDILVKILLRGISEIFLPRLSSRTFTVSHLYLSLLSILSLFLCIV